MNFTKTVKLIPYLCAGLILALVIFSVIQIKNLSTNYSFKQFFPKHHILLSENDKIRQTFQLQESSSFLVVLQRPALEKNSHWLRPDLMKKLKQATVLLKTVAGVNSTLSVATIEGAHEEAQSLVIGPLFENLPLEKWASMVKTNEVIHSQLISDDLKSVLLIVEPKSNVTPSGLSEISKQIEKKIKNIFPEVHVEIGGSPAVQSQFSIQLFKELKVFLTLTLLIFCGIFFVFFHGVSSLIFTLLCLLICNVVTLGFLSIAHIPFSILLSTLPIITSNALVSIVIHTLHRWAERRHENHFEDQNLQKESWLVIKEMLVPNFLGSFTTSIGFITLCSAHIPLIQQYGWVVAAAVMISWILVQVLLFGFMFLTRPRLRRWTESKSTWTVPLLRYSLPLFIGIILFAGFMTYSGKDINFSGRLFDDLPPQDSARQATQKIDSLFGGIVPYELIIESKEKDFWKKPESLKKINNLISQFRQQRYIGSAITFSDFFAGAIPKSQSAVAELQFLYSLSEANPLKNFVTENGQSLRLAIRFHDVPTKQIERARAGLKALIKSKFPQVSFKEAGLAVMSHSINKEVSRGLVFSFWHSLVLIGILLMFVFKSLRWAIVACIPNLIPPAVLLGVLAITQTTIKPGVALIFSIALGLAFNNTVYLLSRLQKIMKDKKMHHVPLKQALWQEGNPCLFETMIMFSGFSIFLISNFKANQIFGVYMLLSILAGALGDLVFLPVMLKLFPQLLQKKATPQDVPVSNIEKPNWAAAAGIGIVFITSGFLYAQPAQADEAHDILSQVRKNIEAQDDQSDVKMKIKESNGEIKNRSLKLQTLRQKNKFYALVRIQSPADIKGTGFLAEISNGNETQWLYLPSSKQVRRVVGTKKSSGVLGSELTTEDLNSTAIKGARVALMKKTQHDVLIDLTPSRGTSLYTKVSMIISIPEYLPLKTQYYKGAQVVKTVDFLNYKKIESGAKSVWRAQNIKVKNLSNKRGTDLELSQVKANSGLKSEDFSVNALKSN